MLSCKKVTERTSALIDRELGWLETLELRMHLVFCKGCRLFISQMRTTDELTHSVAEAEVQAETDDEQISAILSRLHGEKQSGD